MQPAHDSLLESGDTHEAQRSIGDIGIVARYSFKVETHPSSEVARSSVFLKEDNRLSGRDDQQDGVDDDLHRDVGKRTPWRCPQ